MIKSELIDKLSEDNPSFYHKDISKAVSVVLSEISDSLADGRRVELRGFGVFYVKERKPRSGRNPKTGEKIELNKRFALLFRIGKELHNKLNNADEDEK